MIRPKPARWFELLVARDDATLALEALAGTGAVELEARGAAILPAALADIRPLLRQYMELSLRYHAYWPSDHYRASAFPETPVTTLERSITHIRAWAQDAEPVIQQLQRGESERQELARWQSRAPCDGREQRRLRADGQRGSTGAGAALRVPARQ